MRPSRDLESVLVSLLAAGEDRFDVRTHLGLRGREPIQVRTSSVRIDARERTRERGEDARILAWSNGLEERAHETLLRRETLLQKPDRARPRFWQSAGEG